MSTRGAIARVAGPKSFVGVYHHWDAYPSGLGKGLFELYNGHFERDLPAMMKALVDDHPAGWSTILGADWSLPAGFRDTEMMPCLICDKPSWAHYRQQYKAMKRRVPKGAPEGVLVLGHTPERDYDAPHGPLCYCHGSRSEEANEITEANASDCGVEYAYAFEEDGRVMHILSSYCEDGTKMIGMFGFGDPDAVWKGIGTVDLDGDEPDWGSFATR